MAFARAILKNPQASRMAMLSMRAQREGGHGPGCRCNGLGEGHKQELLDLMLICPGSMQILLLDEATSALDSITERKIQVSARRDVGVKKRGRGHSVGQMM